MKWIEGTHIDVSMAVLEGFAADDVVMQCVYLEPRRTRQRDWWLESVWAQKCRGQDLFPHGQRDLQRHHL